MIPPLRPIELRLLLEREVRDAVDATRLTGQDVEPLIIVAGVLERHQERAEVKARLEFLWAYLEAYVDFLIGLPANR